MNNFQYICLSVCLSTHIFQKPHDKTSLSFSVHVDCASQSVIPGVAVHYAVRYVFPVLWMTQWAL